jgi:hypothetical protein
MHHTDRQWPALRKHSELHRTVTVRRTLCAEHCAQNTERGIRCATLRLLQRHSAQFVVIFITGFLANRLGNAEYSAKFAPRPYVKCGRH